MSQCIELTSPIALPLTAEEKLRLQILAWKTRHPGVTAAAVEDLRASVFPEVPTWYKIRSTLKRLAPDIEAVEYPCCVKTCYARTEDTTRMACPHCDEPLFFGGNTSRPRKVYPVFPIGPRLVRSWSRADRAEHFRKRHTDAEERAGGPALDYTDGRVYRRLCERYDTDKYTHFLAISLDGFQIFEQYVFYLTFWFFH